MLKKDNKICFIMCVNEDRMAQEAAYYISHLKVPEGYEVEVSMIRGASSMCAGYNEGMRRSDARYKVYLHQDVFIVNRDFLSDMLAIFRDEGIGMLGVYGSPRMPENGIMWEAPRVGAVWSAKIAGVRLEREGSIPGRYQEVEALDGILIATQYDLPWREDVFRKWHFYDVSQGMEFRKKGYRVVVANQREPWCIHEEGCPDLTDYYETELPTYLSYRSECQSPGTFAAEQT